MVILFTVIGLLLRLVGANQSFWLDEGASIEIARTGLASFMTKMATDFHPPLFYLLLKLWLPLAGHTEWLIRLPFILLSAATVPALYLLLRQIFIEKNQMAPRIGLIFLAISPFHIYYSQELRMYSLNTLLTVLSWYFLILTQKRDRTKYYLLFTLANALNLYTFYGAFFNLAAQIIYILVTKKKILYLFSSLALSILCFLPWIPTLLKQLEVGGYLKTALPGWQILSGSLTLKALVLIPLKLYFGRISFSPKIIYYALSGITSLVYLLLGFWGAREKKSLGLVLWALTPLVIAILISLKTPVLGYWRFLFILPSLIALSAVGLSRFSLSVGGVTFWLLVILTLIPLPIYYLGKENQREDWRGFSNFINKPQTLVVLNYPYIFAPLKFYSPNADFFFTQSSLGHARSDLGSALSVPASGKTRIILMDYLSDLTDPQRSAQKQIEEMGFHQAQVTSFNNLGFVYVYTQPEL